MQEADDFRAEARALAEVTAGFSDQDFTRPTLFKGWTIGDIIGHLHLFDCAARLSATNETEYAEFVAPVMAGMAEGRGLLPIQNDWLQGLAGKALREKWIRSAEETADVFAALDAKARLKWIGPDMSARSSITARQMETWSHGQAVFDLLGLEREEADRVANICHLGVSTFSWTFINRGEPVPETSPFVRLKLPSGAVREWGDPESPERVEGDAVSFAQIVTQTRNIADTDIRTTGEIAASWMARAQCFAGPPNDPPKPGTRFVQRS